MQRIFRFVFWSAIAVTFYLCLRKAIIVAHLSDKTEHLTTFGGLMLLAGMAYPRAGIAWQALALSGFGALIEFVQPYFGRDRDVKDWIADSIGIALAVIIVLIARRVYPPLRATA